MNCSAQHEARPREAGPDAVVAKLFGAQRMVLQAILDAQGDTQAYIEDTRIVQSTQISLQDLRDWFLTLDHDAYAELALTGSGGPRTIHR